MSKITLYNDAGEYALKDYGIHSLTKEGGGTATGKLVQVKKNGDPYRLFITNAVAPGKYILGREPRLPDRLARKLAKYKSNLEWYDRHGKRRMAWWTKRKINKLRKGIRPMGGSTVYVLPGNTYPLPNPEIKPTFNMGKVFERPITGMAAVTAGGAMAYSGYIAGSALGALYGAALIGSLGLLGFIPYLLARIYGKGKRLKSYFRGESKFYSKSQEDLYSSAPRIVEELEKLIAPKQEAAAVQTYTAQAGVAAEA